VPRRRGSRWVIVYDGPINRHPLRDFARHVVDFFTCFVGMAWLPLIFGFVLASALSLAGADFLFIFTLCVATVVVICGVVAGGGVVSYHLENCSVPPRMCELRRARCYVRKCEYNRWWRCIREE